MLPTSMASARAIRSFFSESGLSISRALTIIPISLAVKIISFMLARYKRSRLRPFAGLRLERLLNAALDNNSVLNDSRSVPCMWFGVVRSFQGDIAVSGCWEHSAGLIGFHSARYLHTHDSRHTARRGMVQYPHIWILDIFPV